MRKLMTPIRVGQTLPDDDNYCAIRAFANCTYYDIKQVRTTFENLGRVNRKGTSLRVLSIACQAVGAKITTFGANKWTRALHATSDDIKHNHKGITLGRLAPMLTGRHLVVTNEHATTIIKGELVDTFANSAHARVYAVFTF